MGKKRMIGIKKLSMDILGQVLLSKKTKLIRSLENRAKNLELRIIKKSRLLSRLNRNVERTKNSHKQLLKKFSESKKKMRNAKHLLKKLQNEKSKLQSRPTHVKENSGIATTPMPKAQDLLNGDALTTQEPDGILQIRKKYPNLPKNQIERIEVERTIARHLMGQNSGCFYVSKILQTIEDLYSIKPNDRVILLNEIKNWIERDPLCRAVKTIDKVHHYALI